VGARLWSPSARQRGGAAAWRRQSPVAKRSLARQRGGAAAPVAGCRALSRPSATADARERGVVACEHGATAEPTRFSPLVIER
jgi:hypothetical protein